MGDRKIPQVAVVTGAASGIGRALVLALARRGDAVIASDIDARGLHETVGYARVLGSTVVPVTTDVSKEDDIERLASLAFDVAERVHQLVNNAGVLLSGNCWQTSLPGWKRTIDINLWSVIHATRSFVLRMLDSGGHIVNIASMAGLTPGCDVAAYTVSKYGVVAHSECLAAELALRKAPIKVSVVCPRAVRTGIASSLQQGESVGSTHAAIKATLQHVIREGMAPEALAKHLLSEVDAGKFWIVPHAEVLAAVEHRAEQILRSSIASGI
ncbi:short-subunit dehydrogenase [Paraburkholderia sp. BL18I3N2]|uniref:SDR family NAD(P)-dependent oxidoreductase n=1 Tax=Paraburkholderia sp. BL18I3N2 TaxID=1938799 RepID=UPI000D4B521B|nr:SDR family NAD(P)-dependent oxidoreductase [Paraburkholderia sp. BL18I3N2]PRX27374.1 short-subunit dehydrogenase [Paraburkholderia sp. BL18I3N2]